MNDFIIMPIEKQYKKCLCCGKEFTVELFVEQDFCNKCYPIVVRETFKKENENLTCEELKEKIRNIVLKGEIK